LLGVEKGWVAHNLVVSLGYSSVVGVFPTVRMTGP